MRLSLRGGGSWSEFLDGGVGGAGELTVSESEGRLWMVITWASEVASVDAGPLGRAGSSCAVAVCSWRCGPASS